jgi:hypothetical protein
VTKNLPEALKWYRIAAERGDRESLAASRRDRSARNALIATPATGPFCATATNPCARSVRAIDWRQCGGYVIRTIPYRRVPSIMGEITSTFSASG